MEHHSLIGPFLDHPHETYQWPRQFGFWPPRHYAERISLDDCIMKEEVLDCGLLPLADAGNGDLWLISITDGPLSPVILFDLSGMEKTSVSRDLPHFLAECSFPPPR